MTQKLTLLRLEKQAAQLQNNPIQNAIVVRVGTLHFHFCLHGLEGPYAGGFYHGLLQLHENYPFRAPKLFFFTPSGRFQVNTPICTSFTNYHQQTWTSAWNVRTLIIATISFMYSDQPSFGCSNKTLSIRRTLARQSLRFNLKNPQFVSLFGDKSVLNGGQLIQLKNLQHSQSDELLRQEQLVDEAALNVELVLNNRLGNAQRCGRLKVILCMLLGLIILILLLTL